MAEPKQSKYRESFLGRIYCIILLPQIRWQFMVGTLKKVFWLLALFAIPTFLTFRNHGPGFGFKFLFAWVIAGVVATGIQYVLRNAQFVFSEESIVLVCRKKCMIEASSTNQVFFQELGFDHVAVVIQSEGKEEVICFDSETAVQIRRELDTRLTVHPSTRIERSDQ